jgi:hypothetical protein
MDFVGGRATRKIRYPNIYLRHNYFNVIFSLVVSGRGRQAGPISAIGFRRIWRTHGRKPEGLS